MKLFFSMLTACIFGVVLAFGGIAVFEYSIDRSNKSDKVALAIDDTGYIEEADQDPTFISKFSRVFIYSADKDSEEIIQSAGNSLPHSTNTKISSKAYSVINLDGNFTILEKESDKVLPIASITKLITAVVAKKLINQNQYIPITKKVLNTYGNEANLREGEKLKVDELLYPLLMVSSNDSAEALAQVYSKGRREFINEMNTWVNSIGAYHTYFTDPSGLSPLNVSTVGDLGIIIKWIEKNDPDLFEITKLKSKTIRTHTWTNPTHLLNLTSYAGGKNGFTPEANRTSIALFKVGKQNRLLAIIILGSSNRDSDIFDLLQEAIR